MNSCRLLVLCILAFNAGFARGCEIVYNALTNTIANGCLAQKRTIKSLREWGAPQRLFSESHFSNLVNAVSLHVNECDATFVNGLTGIVERTAFVAALVECGPEVYRDSVVRWYGNSSNLTNADVRVLDSLLFPIGTNMEDYMDMHYDAPGVSNVLIRSKLLYLSIGDDASATAVENILSGRVRASKLRDLDSGLLDRILDGNTR